MNGLTQVQACNRALSLLGVRPISSLDDSTDEASKCGDWFDIARRHFLGLHGWSFALKTVALPAINDPAFVDSRWDYAYPLPSDFIALTRIGDVGQESEPFVRVGLRIYTGLNPFMITYVRDAEEIPYFGPIASEAFAHCLAMYLAPGLTRKAGAVVNWLKMFELQLESAIADDIAHGGMDILDTRLHNEGTDTWIAARRV